MDPTRSAGKSKRLLFYYASPRMIFSPLFPQLGKCGYCCGQVCWREMRVAVCDGQAGVAKEGSNYAKHCLLK